MKYDEQYAKAVKDDTAKDMVSAIKTDWEPGETIVGMLVSIDDITFEETQSTVNTYQFDTDDGLIQFTMGAGVDMQLDTKMVVGNVYACTFIEKKEISKGRTLNIFRVLDCGKVKGHDSNKK